MVRLRAPSADQSNVYECNTIPFLVVVNELDVLWKELFWAKLDLLGNYWKD